MGLLTLFVLLQAAALEAIPASHDLLHASSEQHKTQNQLPEDLLDLMQLKTTLKTQGVTPPADSLLWPRLPQNVRPATCRAFPGCDEPPSPEYKVPDTVQYVDVNLLDYIDHTPSEKESAQLEFVTSHEAMDEFVSYYNGVVDEEFDKFHQDLADTMHREQDVDLEAGESFEELSTRGMSGTSGSANTSGIWDSGSHWFSKDHDIGQDLLKHYEELKKTASANVTKVKHAGEAVAAHVANNGAAFFIGLIARIKDIFAAVSKFTDCIAEVQTGGHSVFASFVSASEKASSAEGGFFHNIIPNTIHEVMGPFMQSNMKSVQSQAKVDEANMDEKPVTANANQMKNDVHDVHVATNKTMGQLNQLAEAHPKTSLFCITEHLIKPAVDAAKDAIKKFTDVLMIPFKKGFHFLMTKATALLGKLVEKLGATVGTAFRKAPTTIDETGVANEETSSGNTHTENVGTKATHHNPVATPLSGVTQRNNTFHSTGGATNGVLPPIARKGWLCDDSKCNIGNFGCQPGACKTIDDKGTCACYAQQTSFIDMPDAATHQGGPSSIDKEELLALARKTTSEHCMNQLSTKVAPSLTSSLLRNPQDKVFSIASSVLETFLSGYLGQLTGMIFVPLLQKGIGFMSMLLNTALSVMTSVCGLVPEIGAGLCSGVTNIITNAERLTHNGLVVSGVQFLQGHFAEIVGQAPTLMKAILLSKAGGTTQLDEDAPVLRVPEAFQPLVPHLMNIADLVAGEVQIHLGKCDVVHQHLDLVHQHLAQKDEELRKAKEMLQRFNASM